MTRWFRCSLAVAGPFVCRCLTSSTMLRLHTQLIEPDVRNDRIRLSEKVSRGRPRETTRPHWKADEAQHLIEEALRKPSRRPSGHLVFGT